MNRILSLLLVCLLGSTTLAQAKTPGEVAIGGTLREATMQGLSGASQKLSEFRGKPLIINVWASWCGPCRLEMGSLERLSRRRGPQQFAMIGISTDDYRDKALGFLNSYKTNFSHFIDSQLVLENMLGADRLPLTLLVDAKGKVLAKYYGASEWDSPENVKMIEKTFGIKL
jgi:thiol-disulfide isomerase/thioredoxin